MGFKYLSFTGQTGCYAELPLSVLPGATTFTIEIKLATTSTKTSSNNWQRAHICGREIGGNWQDDFGLCVNGGKLCFWAEPVSRKGNDWTGVTTNTNAVVNDGLIHKVAVVSSNGAIDLYCDGALVAHTDNVKAKITSAQTILLAYNSDSASYLQMDLYEARFWNVARTQEQIGAVIDGSETGLQAWYLPGQGTLNDYSGNNRHATLYGNPAYHEADSIDVSLVADVQRKIKNALLTWRYENPGDANDLIIPSTVLTNLPATQSKTGTAFYQTARARCFDLPATSEVWIKFDVYTTGSQRWRAYNGGTNGATGVCSYVGASVDFGMWQNSTKIQDFSGVCKTNQLQTVLLHMISGSSDGIVEAWVDGNFIYRYTGDVNHGQDFADIYLQSDGSSNFFSNVIISNAEIGLDENAQTGTIIRVDVQRRITNVVTVTADAQRRIANAETIIADTQRVISNNKIIFTPEIYVSWIPGGAINFAPEIYASWIPEEPAATFIFDAQRRIINAETIIADTQRRVTFESQTFIFDAQRRIGNHITITADTRRKITRTEKLTVDVQRRLEITATIAADTEVKINRSWLTRILPDSSFLDETFYASAKALDFKISDLFADTPEVLHLPRLNFLSGIILDVLAEQFHVDAYDAINFSDAEKRDLIRESIAWHRIKGTPAAVKMVLGGVFKDLRVPEWFEYGGEPYYFRLWCRGYTSTPERFKSFWNMFWDAKNVRSHLEKVTFDLSPDEPMRLYAGVGRINHGYKNILLPKPTDQNAFVYAGAAKIIRGTIRLTTEIPDLPPPDDTTLKLFVGNAKIIRGNIAVKMQDFTA